MTLENLMMILWLALLCHAALTDARHARIPNRICGLLLVPGIVWQIQGGLEKLILSMLLSLTLLIAGYLLYLTGGLGGGDAKLIAAASLLPGASFTAGLSAGRQVLPEVPGALFFLALSMGIGLAAGIIKTLKS